MKTLSDLYTKHPNLVSWAVLAIAMVIVLLVAARDVGFQLTQWLALIGATVALAGACVWIISWETPDEADGP
jgi:hypothetical protein